MKKNHTVRTSRQPAAGTPASVSSACACEPLASFRFYLISRDVRQNTVDKYVRDVNHFLCFNQSRELDHDAVACYRDYLSRCYQPSSANSMLAALNRFLVFLGKEECCVRVLRVQRELFRDESRDLSVEEYQRLVLQAEKDGNRRLSHILQTMACSGIRVGELSSITVESLDQVTVSVSSKGKIRQILLPDTLVKILKQYCREEGLTSGHIFVTRTGRPVDRRNIWKEIKTLCRRAGVEESKGFPHNLRHLFARCFYEKEKDIVRLADYLGHSSVETTRRYTATSRMQECRQALEMGLALAPGTGGTGAGEAENASAGGRKAGSTCAGAGKAEGTCTEARRAEGVCTGAGEAESTCTGAGKAENVRAGGGTCAASTGCPSRQPASHRRDSQPARRPRE